MIEFRDLKKSFGDRRVLDGVSLNVAPGEIVVVLGRSGTGKSVLLKHVVGLLRPDAGSVVVEGRAVEDLSESGLHEVRRECGMVFQLPALLDSLTVFDNVAFGVRVHRPRTSAAKLRAEVGDALSAVGLGPDVWYQMPPQLSVGTQKRVSLARTVAVGPKYLLFDEPTTGLDPMATAAINRLVLRMTRRLGAGALVVSHDLPGALEIGDRLVLLDSGKVRFTGTAAQFRRSELPLAREFRTAAGVDT